MHPLEEEIRSIAEQCVQGNITAEERDYLLQEIRDVRAAQAAAGNEVVFRYLVQACNYAMSGM